MLSLSILAILLILTAFLAGCIVGCWLGRRHAGRLEVPRGSRGKAKSAKTSAKRTSKRRG